MYVNHMKKPWTIENWQFLYVHVENRYESLVPEHYHFQSEIEVFRYELDQDISRS